MTIDIDEVYRTAIASSPFAYQRRIAETGLPELLEVPTGCGKTPAILLGWVFRRCLHPDPAVRNGTPTRLIWCLPLRTLTGQTAELARAWVRRLGLADEVDVHLLMGGEPLTDQAWRLNPQRPAVIVSTLDMALSRALNRGYLASRYAWPIDFALFNDDCHWVFDEVQLMDVALPTSRQLHGLRHALGVRSRHSSTWMSATVDHDALSTVDAPIVGEPTNLDTEDRKDVALAPRLGAAKRFVRTHLTDASKFARSVADVVRQEHVELTLTVVVVNTITAAQELADNLRKAPAAGDPEVVLLHSRFRHADRAAALGRVLDHADDDAGGLIVVSTQVIEAGVDISARTLVTECAPWSSIVQRAGRCNRWGELDEARVVVVDASKRTPYRPVELERAWEIAGSIHGSVVTPGSLAEITATTAAPPLLTLRRKDLVDLFDTTPDVAGNDVDVSRFIRADGDLDVSIAWRELGDEPADAVGRRPGRDERCPVPVGTVREWFKKLTRAPWTYDHLERRWRHARADDIRPGAQFVVDASAGGYDAVIGFKPELTGRVEPIDSQPGQPTLDDDNDIASNTLTTEFGRAVPLAEHLADTERAARTLCDELRVDDGDVRLAITLAARLHDVGKAHPVFQSALHERSPETDRSTPLAKSATAGRLPIPTDRAGFRHELASVAILEANPHLAAAHGADAALVTYLVGAHHGRIRLGIRSLSGEPDNQVLGVRSSDHIERTDLGGGHVAEPTVVDLTMCQLGGDSRQASWTTRAVDLLDEYGPFRLAWMEAVVRIADWRASIESAAP